MSELKVIQEELLRRFKRPRTTVNDIPGYAGGNLGEQLDREGQSPDRMSGVRSVFSPPQDRANREYGISMLPGHGFEETPYDQNYPDEIPQQTKRRLEQQAIWRNPQGDPLRKANELRDEFGDPTAAQFPVSAATKTALYNDGYGAGFTKSALDPGGYEPPRQRSVFAPPRGPSSVSATEALRDDPATRRQLAENPANRSYNGVPLHRPRSVFAPPTNSEGVTDFRVPKQGEELPPVSMSRDRRAEPRDYVGDSAQYLRDLEDKPRNWKDKAVDVLRVVNQAFGSNPNVFMPTKKEREILKARGMLGQDIALEDRAINQRATQSQINERLSKPPASSTRIVDADEYEGIPAGTEIRQEWDPRQRRMVDVAGRGGKPVVAKAPPAEKAAASEIKYNHKGEAVLVPKDGGRAKPIFNLDGTPLTKEDNESGTVQTAFRLEPDGITQVQIERDRSTGQWVDSVGPNGKPIRHGQVGKIDPETGAPMAAIVTAGRIESREESERKAKKAAYEREASDWSSKESTYRQNKANEDAAVKAKQDQMQKLYAEKRSWTPQILGARSSDEIQTDIDRLSAEIKTHRANSTEFQRQANDAAKQATTARRNAGLIPDTPASNNGRSTRSAKPGRIQANEHPGIRDYANKFFKGDYNIAKWAKETGFKGTYAEAQKAYRSRK